VHEAHPDNRLQPEGGEQAVGVKASKPDSNVVLVHLLHHLLALDPVNHEADGGDSLESAGFHSPNQTNTPGGLRRDVLEEARHQLHLMFRDETEGYEVFLYIFEARTDKGVCVKWEKKRRGTLHNFLASDRFLVCSLGGQGAEVLGDGGKGGHQLKAGLSRLQLVRNVVWVNTSVVNGGHCLHATLLGIARGDVRSIDLRQQERKNELSRLGRRRTRGQTL